MQIAPQFADVFRELGIDGDAIFEHPAIQTWRSLPDRQNCTLDAVLREGRRVRFHIKRYTARPRGRDLAGAEVAGLRLLAERGIPTADLVGWGALPDRRSFIILDDLRGYQAADKLVANGLSFEMILESTAQLCAKLHDAGLHHRDLYLCHFFARVEQDSVDLRLIDAARVRELPGFFAQRWIVKDLSQFWYSMLALPIRDQQRTRWLDTYARARRIDDVQELRRRIERKSARIARHDTRLRACEPLRNISIPQSS